MDEALGLWKLASAVGLVTVPWPQRHSPPSPLQSSLPPAVVRARSNSWVVSACPVDKTRDRDGNIYWKPKPLNPIHTGID